MSERGLSLPGEAIRDLQEIKHIVLGSTRTRRARRRRRRGGMSDGATSSGDKRTGRVVAFIPAATNTHAPGWKVVTNAVSLLDEATGAEIDADHPITITNKIPYDFPVDAWVQLNGSEIDNGTCYAMPAEFWEVPEEE